jgi:hypothetical protein
MVQDTTKGFPGGLCVYRMPQTTGDAATDAAASLIRNRLSEMNAANAAFWAGRDEVMKPCFMLLVVAEKCRLSATRLCRAFYHLSRRVATFRR